MSETQNAPQTQAEQTTEQGHVHGPHCSHGHQQEPFVRATAKVGRNDPCPCGSQQKFKKCHGK